MITEYPPQDATREQIAAWIKEHGPKPALAEGVPHEAPRVENGPSIVCNACEVVRVPITKPFCNGCMRVMGC